MSFFGEKFTNLLINLDVASLIGKIKQYQGRLEVYEKEFPCTLEKLQRSTQLQHTKDFVAMYKNLKITNKRLKELIIYDMSPKTMIEDEISCYVDALSLIHNNYERLTIDPGTILEIHFQLFKYATSDSGTWRRQEILLEEHAQLNFSFYCYRPLTIKEIPEAVKKLCEEYNYLLNQKEIDPLLLICNFVLNFICIFPFESGNGRMVRLLISLLLLQSKHSLVKYISLDKIIKKYGRDYYDALYKSSANWHFQEHNISFILKCLLHIILEAYKELDVHITSYQLKGNKSFKIKEYILKQELPFTKEAIRMVFSDVSPSTINKAFACLQEDKLIELKSKGRNAVWIKTKI